MLSFFLTKILPAKLDGDERFIEDTCKKNAKRHETRKISAKFEHDDWKIEIGNSTSPMTRSATRVLQRLFAIYCYKSDEKEDEKRTIEKFGDAWDRANSWAIELNRRKYNTPACIFYTHVSTRKWTSEWHFSRQERASFTWKRNEWPVTEDWVKRTEDTR